MNKRSGFEMTRRGCSNCVRSLTNFITEFGVYTSILCFLHVKKQVNYSTYCLTYRQLMVVKTGIFQTILQKAKLALIIQLKYYSAQLNKTVSKTNEDTSNDQRSETEFGYHLPIIKFCFNKSQPQHFHALYAYYVQCDFADQTFLGIFRQSWLTIGYHIVEPQRSF